jgi:hypothetical protein
MNRTDPARNIVAGWSGRRRGDEPGADQRAEWFRAGEQTDHRGRGVERHLAPGRQYGGIGEAEHVHQHGDQHDPAQDGMAAADPDCLGDGSGYQAQRHRADLLAVLETDAGREPERISQGPDRVGAADPDRLEGEPAEDRTKHARHAVRHRVECHGGGYQRLASGLARHPPPDGHVCRPDHAVGEAADGELPDFQSAGGSRQCQQRRRGKVQALAEIEQPLAVHRFGEGAGQRAGGEHRQRAQHRYQRDGERRAGDREHVEAAGEDLQPAHRVREHAGSP